MRLLLPAAWLLIASALSAGTAEAQSGSSPPAPSGADSALVADLVAANRILADQGVVDGFGHISVRHDKNKAHFLLARSMAPALVQAEDIMEFDETCEPVDAKGRSPYLERFIHCEIFRARPEVQSVVHTHSPAIIPFGVARVPLKPVYHMSGFLGETTPVFEIRDTAGPSTDMLIRSRALGQVLAAALGSRPVLLMRGHGVTVVGNGIQQAVFRAVYTEVNAKLEADAMKLGEVTFLNADEAQNAATTNDGQIGRSWALWKMRVEPKR